MAVYVTPQTQGIGDSCLLLADSVDELRRFAGRLDLGSRNRRDYPCPCWVLTRGYRWQAIRRGAVELSQEESVAMIRKWQTAIGVMS